MEKITQFLFDVDFGTLSFITCPLTCTYLLTLRDKRYIQGIGRGVLPIGEAHPILSYATAERER